MENNEAYYNRSIYTALRIGFIALLFVWSFMIIEPFLLPVIWGIIIAVSIFPLYEKTTLLLGNRSKLAATLLTLIGLALLILPSTIFISSTADGLKQLATELEAGTLVIPAPNTSVAEWPIVGKPIYDIWLLASTNLESVITKFAPQLKELAPKVFSVASGIGSTLLLFIVSIIIAGVFLHKADSSEKAAKSIFTTLIGVQGESFVELSVKTIRSVVQGVLGVAIIQAILGGVGIWAVGIPAAGLWALIILFLAILQLPPILILGPLALYAFSVASATPAVIFLIWSIIVSASDAFLKPIFLGRGVDVPMLSILLGAIGGMMLSGIIGLFVGAVVLALSYKVFEALLVDDVLDKEEVD